MLIHPPLLVTLVVGAILGSLNALLIAAIPMFVIRESSNQFTVLCFLVLAKLLISALLRVTRVVTEQEIQHLNQKVVLTFSEKAMKLPYQDLENPKIMDLRQQALFAINSYGSLISLFHQTATMMSSLLTLLSITGILIGFSWQLCTAVVLISSVGVYLSAQQTAKLTESLSNNSQISRIYSYFMEKSLSPDLQKESRVYDLNRLIVGRLRQTSQNLSKWIQSLSVMEGKASTYFYILTYLSTFCALTYSAVRYSSNIWGTQIEIGEFTFYVGISIQFANSLLLLSGSISQIKHNLDILEPFQKFMNLPEAGNDTGTDKTGSFETLEFRDLSFAYPNSKHDVLKGINFTIKKGEHISIVGLNGAGKTTLIKLLCRLYIPQSGTILWNGKPIQAYDYADYIHKISTVFQDFKFIPLSIRDNLNPLGELSDAEIFAVLDQLEMSKHVREKEYGLDGVMALSLDKKGVEFSGGQLQKLAIARALLKKSDILILDEPTAALDPLAESEIYHHLSKLLKGHTVIFISHRMSSSLFCDKVLVIQEGKNIAFAPHEELMKTTPLYNTLFSAQAKYYRQDDGRKAS